MTKKPKVARFQWTRQKERAALLAAEDELTDAQIAKEVGVSHSVISRLRVVPEFKARIAEHVESFRKKIRDRSIAIKEIRIDTYIADFQATDLILKERGAELADECGGGSTGFIVKDFKGKEADRAVYAVDAGLIRSRLNIREQLAKELGQWTEKSELTGKDGGPLSIATFDAILAEAE